MVLDIAKRFNDVMKVRTLASKLHVPDYQTDQFLQASKTVPDAAVEVIQEWKGNTKDDAEAFEIMKQVLTEMNQIRILHDVMGVM